MHSVPTPKQLLGAVIKAITEADGAAALALLKQNKQMLQSNREEISNVRASVLYYAIQYSCVGLVTFTLNMAPVPDINFYRMYGSTLIGLAIEKNAEALPLLYAKADRSLALHAAVKSKQKKVVSALLDRFHFSNRLLTYLGLKA